MEVEPQFLFEIYEVLTWCEGFFVGRDKMNAAVHCAPMRLLPLTVAVEEKRARLMEMLHGQPAGATVGE